MMNFLVTKIEETEEELASIEIEAGYGMYYSIYEKTELEDLIKELEEVVAVLKINLKTW